ncbi:MAG: helix-turn-helix domain-containing protein [Candidatus Saccharimonadales bacterium]
MKEVRFSDSPHILGVNRRDYNGNTDVTVPDCCWDILVIKYDGQTQVVLTGTITQPIPLEFPPGTEVMNITFQPDTFLSDFPAPKMLNNGVELPSAGKNKVWLGSEIIEVPTFDNAEEFVGKLRKTGSMKNDKLVGRILEGKSMAASERSVQRHFMQTTGMTMKFIQQVQRAQSAVDLLRQGRRIVDIAHALGYTDQAHMTRSLKGIMGITPAAIAQGAKAPPTNCPYCVQSWLHQTGVMDGRHHHSPYPQAML